MDKLSNPGKLGVILFGALVLFGVASLVLTPERENQADPGNVAAVAVGARLYEEHCAACHGENLEGQPNWRVPGEDGILPAPPHDQSGHTWHHGDDLLFSYTKKGGAALVPEGFRSGMPGFAATLKDSEIWDILAFIKSTWPEDIRAAQAGR